MTVQRFRGSCNADEISLTSFPVRMNATGKQALKDALDVSPYDWLDLFLLVPALEGTTPTVTIRVLTGMQTETEDGWAVAVLFTQVSASNVVEFKTDVKIGKYVRWEVSQISSGAAVTFMVPGMARRHR